MRALSYSLLFITTVALGLEPMTVRQKVDELRQRGRREGWTFEVKENDLLELPLEWRHGLRVDREQLASLPHVAVRVPDTLPKVFDWRTKGVVRPVRNQHSPNHCGSCWAHATAAVFESAIQLATGKIVSVAPQQLVSCDSSDMGCEGGFASFDFYQDHGANYEADFPYVAADVPCRQAAEHEHVAQFGEVGNNPSIDEIKAGLVKYGPLATYVYDDDAWDAYKSGVFNACNQSGAINHAVTIVGWNDNEQAWIVKNSHGVEFGNAGYIDVAYLASDGQHCSSLGNDAFYATAKASAEE